MGSASTPPVRHRRDARKRTPFSHARRERALFNFVGVLDGRLGHADGLWVSGGGRGGEVDARGFVWWRRVGACERRVASMLYLSPSTPWYYLYPTAGPSLYTPPERRRGTAPLHRNGMPSRHHLSIPHRNAVAATLGKDAVSRTLRSSDRFGGRLVFSFWCRGVVGVAGGRCLRRFCVVLVRERVGGELRGGHRFGCPNRPAVRGSL